MINQAEKHRRTNRSWLLCLLVASLLSMLNACAVYHPQTVDIPLLDHRSDLRIDAAASLTEAGQLDGNLSAAYALTDHIAVQGFGNFTKEQFFVQGALGTYFPLGSGWVAEGYAGYGWGHGTAHSLHPLFSDTREDINGRLDASYNMEFLQLNIGRNAKIVDFGLGLKTGLLSHHTIDSCYYAWGEAYDMNNGMLHFNEHHWLLEPQLFVRLGSENVKFTVRLGYCWMQDTELLTRHFPIHRFNIGFGVNFRLGERR